MTRHEAWPNTHFILESFDFQMVQNHSRTIFLVNLYINFLKKAANGRRI